MDNEGLEKSLHRLKIEQQTDRSLIRILEVANRDLKKDYSNLEDAFVSLAHRLDKKIDDNNGAIEQIDKRTENWYSNNVDRITNLNKELREMKDGLDEVVISSNSTEVRFLLHESAHNYKKKKWWKLW